jgi:hypothetical protein
LNLIEKLESWLILSAIDFVLFPILNCHPERSEGTHLSAAKELT